MDKVLKVKLKVNNNEDYNHFCNMVNRYEQNTNIFKGRRRLGRVFNVTEHFRMANFVRLKTTAGEQLHGQYDIRLFDALKVKIGKSITQYAASLWSTGEMRDTHSTNTEYAVINPNTEGTMSLTEMYERDDAKKEEYQRKNNFKHKWSTSKYCFAQYRTWACDGEAFYERYPFIIGRILPYCDPKMFMEMCEEAKKYGWLDKEAKVWTVEAENYEGERGTHIEYAIPHTKPYNTSYYYFQLSFMRMCREYAGTVKVAKKLMDKWNIALPLAMCIAYQECDNPYSLHIAFPKPCETYDYEEALTALSIAQAIQEYLTILRDPENDIDVKGFNTTDTIYGMAMDGETPLKLTTNNVNKINKLIKEVEHG